MTDSKSSIFRHPSCGYILPLFWTSWRIQSEDILCALGNLSSVILYYSLFMFCLPSRASGHGLDTLVTFGEGKCNNEKRKYIFNQNLCFLTICDPFILIDPAVFVNRKLNRKKQVLCATQHSGLKLSPKSEKWNAVSSSKWSPSKEKDGGYRSVYCSLSAHYHWVDKLSQTKQLARWTEREK
jgi:hypothetical protein